MNHGRRDVLAGKIPFMERFLFPKDKGQAPPTSSLGAVRAAGLYVHGRWKTPPDLTGGPPLANWLNSIVDVLPTAAPPRRWDGSFVGCALPSDDDDHARRSPIPGVVLLPPDTRACDIRRENIIVYHAGWATPLSSNEVLEGLVPSVRLAFGAQFYRHFALGWSLVKRHASVFLFTRSGIFASDSFPIDRHPRRFLRLVYGFAFAPSPFLGFDRSVDLSGPQPSISIEPDGQSPVRFVVIKVIHCSAVIQGRGTVVLLVQRPDNGAKHVIKMSWIDIRRQQQEWELIACANSHLIAGVPRLEWHDYAKEEDGSPISTSFIHQWADRAMQRFDLNAEQDTELCGTIERLPVLLARELRRIVLADYGEPVEAFRSLSELVHVFKNVVHTLRDLTLNGVIHRDISLRNIMIKNDEPTTGLRNGLLIDFDYAMYMFDQIEDDGKFAHATVGTLPFMAIRLLMRKDHTMHTPADDLESLLYVLIWICITQSGPNNRRRGNGFSLEHSMLQEWRTHPSDHAGSQKRIHMTSTSARHDLFAEFHPYFSGLVPYVNRLVLALFPVDGESLDIMNLYACFESTFADAENDLPRRPEDDEVDMFI